MEVVVPGRVDDPDRAHLTAVDAFPELLESFVVPTVVGDHDGNVERFELRRQRRGLFEFEPDRLLDEDGHACGQRCPGEVGVGVRRTGDDDPVEPIRPVLGERHRADDGDPAGSRRGVSAPQLRPGVRRQFREQLFLGVVEPLLTASDEDELVDPVFLGDVASVHPADPAEADDADPCAHRFSSMIVVR